MKTFIEGGFLAGTLIITGIVIVAALLPLIPFLFKKRFKEAFSSFLIIAVPITVMLTAPMIAIIFNEAYAQVGWVFYFFLAPVAFVYYLIMFVYNIKKSM